MYPMEGSSCPSPFADQNQLDKIFMSTLRLYKEELEDAQTTLEEIMECIKTQFQRIGADFDDYYPGELREALTYLNEVVRLAEK